MPVLFSDLQANFPVEQAAKDLLTGLAEQLLKEHEIPEAAEIGIVFVDDAYIAGLNKQYRGVDAPTDVLSFAMLEGLPMPGDEEEPMLGDVVISLETAQRQAQDFGHSLEREIAYLTVHGVLHLLGYDHQTPPDKEAMRAIEEKALKSVGVSR